VGVSGLPFSCEFRRPYRANSHVCWMCFSALAIRRGFFGGELHLQTARCPRCNPALTKRARQGPIAGGMGRRRSNQLRFRGGCGPCAGGPYRAGPRETCECRWGNACFLHFGWGKPFGGLCEGGNTKLLRRDRYFWPWGRSGAKVAFPNSAKNLLGI